MTSDVFSKYDLRKFYVQLFSIKEYTIHVCIRYVREY